MLLEFSVYKNSEYNSQTKKMILIPNIFFVGAKWFFLHLVARGWENSKFLGGNFQFEYILSVQVFIETLKKVFTKKVNSKKVFSLN